MSTTRQIQLMCAWAGPVTLVLALSGWLIAGVLPVPLGADNSAEEVAAFYSGNPTAVRAGLLIASIGVCFVAPLVAVIAVQMVRMEGRTPILSFLQLVLGAVTVLMLFLPMLMMNIAAFRPDRSPEITMTLNDMAWILFLTPIGPFILQNITIGVAVLRDRSGGQVFPRWAGYANLWCGFLFCPAGLAYFFTTGPFAWQGIFVFWLGLVVYSAWILFMFAVVRGAVLAEVDDAAPGTARAPSTVSA